MPPKANAPAKKATVKKPTAKQASKPAAKPTALAGPLAKLIAKAKGSDLFTVAGAMSDILELGKKAAPARDELRALVPDKEPRRSVYARATLAVLGDDVDAHLDAIMLVAATGKGGAAKSVAKTALWAMPGPLVGQAIARAVRATKPVLRETALMLAGSTVPVRKAVDIETLLPLLDDTDEDVRKMAIHAIHMHVAPGAPAKPTVKLTPALHARVAALRNDPSKAVAERAQRFVKELGER